MVLLGLHMPDTSRVLMCFVGLVLESAKFQEYRYKGKFEEADIYREKLYKFFSAIGYLILACNLISCILMALVLRLVGRVSSKITYGASTIQTQLKTNQL